MSLNKPYKRTVRLLTNNSYRNDGHWQYILHPDYSNDPQHYIRAFSLIQNDLFKLFEYVEPCDENLKTISLRIHELFIRVCIEIEANFTAILTENNYGKKSNFNIKDDYSLIEFTHKLSEYKIKFPVWMGDNNIFTPFKNWSNFPNKDWHVLSWYQDYNKVKHDRHQNFNKATFENLLLAISGLIAVLSSQFMNQSFLGNALSLGIGGNYSYKYDPDYEDGIGGYFKVK